MLPTSSDIPVAAAALRRSRHTAALTGAGVSRDSGLPTFREAQTGLWSRYPPEQLATPEAFQRDPQLVWRWYAWRRGLAEAAAPNAGHVALAALERHAPTFTLITQNVDGLHRRAGSRDVIELHGDITRVRCSRCGGRDAPQPLPDDAPPACVCGGLFRPDVVWFGEMLPAEALRRATAAAAECDVFLVIGTSGVVYPAAGLAGVAARAGARVISVNTDPSAAPPHALQLTGTASAVLPALLAAAFA